MEQALKSTKKENKQINQSIKSVLRRISSLEKQGLNLENRISQVKSRTDQILTNQKQTLNSPSFVPKRNQRNNKQTKKVDEHVKNHPTNKKHTVVANQCTIPGCTTCIQSQNKPKLQQQNISSNNNINVIKSNMKQQSDINKIEINSVSSCSTHSSVQESQNDGQPINIDHICNFGMIQLDQGKTGKKINQWEHRIKKSKPKENGLTRLNSYPTENYINDSNDACFIFEQSAGQWK